MKKDLKTYIDKYIQDANEPDKKIARHLKEIIPKTTHLEKNILDEILEELEKAMEKGRGFKDSFLTVYKKYILAGDTIDAPLPALLTRIILDDTEFVEKINEERGIPSDREDIRDIVESKNRDNVDDLFKSIELNIREVVFATFDEDNMEADPFQDCSIKDIVNMLALNTGSFRDNQPLTAVSIRYKNRDDVLKRFPAFPDAGWYDGFYPSEKDDNYGRTKSREPSLKSMPEIVHENLRLTDVIEEIRFLVFRE